jgi:peptide/nickel transport system permease protein
MRRFLVRRLLQSAFLLFAVVSASFFLVHLTPGGPDTALLQNPRVGPEEIQRIRERFGLNQPLPVQYLSWLANVARLDFGRSYVYSRPATEIIQERLNPTLQLGLMSYAVALLGIPMGVYAAMHRGRAGDTAVRVIASLGHALPGWWLGLALIVLLNTLTGWFPNGQGRGGPLEWLQAIALPALVLGLIGLVTFSRFARSEVLEVLGQDYVRTAQAKGLGARAVAWTHVLRNALLPILTLLGYLLPNVLSGALSIEVVFGWPGLGRLYFEAATSRDYPILLALLTVLTAATILGTLLADLAYGMVDPRVRYP